MQFWKFLNDIFFVVLEECQVREANQEKLKSKKYVHVSST